MILTPSLLKDKLNTAISGVAAVGWLFSRDPYSDFTRERKLPLNSLLHLLLKFSGKSLQSELSAYYIPLKKERWRIPTRSAFSQQRHKLLWEGCYSLFRAFTDSLPYLKLFDGYRLLACDGSSVPIPRNEEEEEYSVIAREDRKSYNQLHINGLFDILNRIYVDVDIDPGMHIKERAALISLVSRLPDPTKVILLADRGYEGYNELAHLIENKINYLIRAKDLDSNGFLHTLHLPSDGELDIDVDKVLSFSASKSHQKDDRFVKVSRGHFDFLKSSADIYPIQFRLVRIQLADGSYESLVTNLPRDKFPPKKLKKLYHLRWGIENAYRDLKYPVDLLHFHGKSAQSVLQEIFCSLTMFNYCAYLCVHADILRVHKHTKYRYKVNFANAVGPCRAYLHGSISEMELLDRLRLAPTPIRPDRHVPRPRIEEQSSREFNYRVS
ncbi:MAG: IS4 family transposase [Clostridia bacterium]|nr:IS4 family transposase [Clostridia bacterium]